MTVKGMGIRSFHYEQALVAPSLGGTLSARGVRIHVAAIVAMARRDLKGKTP